MIQRLSCIADYANFQAHLWNIFDGFLGSQSQSKLIQKKTYPVEYQFLVDHSTKPRTTPMNLELPVNQLAAGSKMAGFLVPNGAFRLD